MKKILLSALLSVCLLAGCAGQPSNIETEAISTDATLEVTEVVETTEPIETITIADYSITGMLNVTDVYFAAKTNASWGTTYAKAAPEEATGIIVYVMCPQCKEETFDLVELTEIPEASIGKQTFTWKGSIDCGNWDNHADPFDSEYKYSIIFTLER